MRPPERSDSPARLFAPTVMWKNLAKSFRAITPYSLVRRVTDRHRHMSKTWISSRPRPGGVNSAQCVTLMIDRAPPGFLRSTLWRITPWNLVSNATIRTIPNLRRLPGSAVPAMLRSPEQRPYLTMWVLNARPVMWRLTNTGLPLEPIGQQNLLGGSSAALVMAKILKTRVL